MFDKVYKKLHTHLLTEVLLDKEPDCHVLEQIHQGEKDICQQCRQREVQVKCYRYAIQYGASRHSRLVICQECAQRMIYDLASSWRIPLYTSK